jgi:hypothetical protein
MGDLLYEKFVKHWERVTEVPPQTIGPFTPVYKEITKRLKVMPWLPIIFVSILAVGGLYLLVGPAVSGIVTLLQRGF